MQSLCSQLKTSFSASYWHSFLPVCWALALGAAILPHNAMASSIADWNLSTDSSNSDAVSAFDDGTFVITGPNNGSGIAGSTDFVFDPTESGVLQFHYYYSTYDPNADAYDLPGYDFGGFLLGETFTRFVDAQPLIVPFSTSPGGPMLAGGMFGPDVSEIFSGNIEIPITLGQLFGFRMGTEDNLFLPGILTISEISFTPTVVTSQVSPTPEPGFLPVLAIVGIAVMLGHRRMRQTQQTEKA